MTKIEWTEKTWNPIVGCSIVSPGCANCYAMKMAARLEAMAAVHRTVMLDGSRFESGVGKLGHYVGTTQPSKAGAVWTGKVALAPDHILTEPLRRNKPTMYFVNSMGDLFHEDIPDEWIARVFYVMAQCRHHTFQILTKRAANMRRVMSDPAFVEDVRSTLLIMNNPDDPAFEWPLPNVWLGVSAERQQEADARIPDLLATPAAVRFVSAEPLLGPIDFAPYLPRVPAGSRNESRDAQLKWIIVGGESGPDARPMHPDWARSIRDQCTAAGVPFFFKQWGEWLVGERQPPADDLTYRPDVVFHDGSDFSVISDGHDILLGAAENEVAGPKPLWRQYWGWRNHLVKRAGKSRAGRLLDGREWSEMPSAPEAHT